MTNRFDILKTAEALTATTRQKEYGSFQQNMDDLAQLCTAYLICKYRGETLDENSFALSAEDLCWFNVIFKMVRTFQSPHMHLDNYVDAVNYAAMAGEARAATQEDAE